MVVSLDITKGGSIGASSFPPPTILAMTLRDLDFKELRQVLNQQPRYLHAVSESGAEQRFQIANCVVAHEDLEKTAPVLYVFVESRQEKTDEWGEVLPEEGVIRLPLQEDDLGSLAAILENQNSKRIFFPSVEGGYFLEYA